MRVWAPCSEAGRGRCSGAPGPPASLRFLLLASDLHPLCAASLLYSLRWVFSRCQKQAPWQVRACISGPHSRGRLIFPPCRVKNPGPGGEIPPPTPHGGGAPRKGHAVLRGERPADSAKHGRPRERRRREVLRVPARPTPPQCRPGRGSVRLAPRRASLCGSGVGGTHRGAPRARQHHACAPGLG